MILRLNVPALVLTSASSKQTLPKPRALLPSVYYPPPSPLQVPPLQPPVPLLPRQRARGALRSARVSKSMPAASLAQPGRLPGPEVHCNPGAWGAIQAGVGTKEAASSVIWGAGQGQLIGTAHAASAGASIAEVAGPARGQGELGCRPGA